MKFYIDDKPIEAQELREIKRREKQLADLRKVLDLPEGRRLMWRIFSETGVFRTSFTGDTTTYFNEGRRDIGLFVMNELFAANPEAFMLMRTEAESDKAKEKLEIKIEQAEMENSEF